MASTASKKSVSPSKLTPEQSKVFMRNFSLFDEHNEGKIAIKELGNLFRSLGMSITKEELDRIVKKLDPHGRVTLTQADFLRFMAGRLVTAEEGTKNEVHSVFRLFDTDGKGYISVNDLQRVADELGEHIKDEALQEMIDKADSAKKGHVSEADFAAVVKKKGLR